MKHTLKGSNWAEKAVKPTRSAYRKETRRWWWVMVLRRLSDDTTSWSSPFSSSDRRVVGRL